jgi:AcrR family transcriptional regulator
MSVDTPIRAQSSCLSAAYRRGDSPSTTLLDAAVFLIAQSGRERVTASAVCLVADLPIDTFSDSFAGLTDLLLAVFDELGARLLTKARTAQLAHPRWEDGVHAALATVLELADRQPHLAAFMLGSLAPEDQLILARREHLERRLAFLLDERRPASGVPSPAFGPAAVVAATVAILQARLGERPTPRLLDLHQPLMAMIVLPYLGAEGARAQFAATSPAGVDS